MKLWKYLQLAGLLVLCPILLAPFLGAGIAGMAIFFKLKSLVESLPSGVFGVIVCVPCLIYLYVLRRRVGVPYDSGRWLRERAARQNGSPPDTNGD